MHAGAVVQLKLIHVRQIVAQMQARIKTVIGIFAADPGGDLVRANRRLLEAQSRERAETAKLVSVGTVDSLNVGVVDEAIRARQIRLPFLRRRIEETAAGVLIHAIPPPVVAGLELRVFAERV